MRLVAFGDSITAHGSREVRPERHWPRLVARRTGVEVLNAGAGGNTTTQGLDRIEKAVLARRPDLVLVQFGFNDCHHPPGSSAPRTSIDLFEGNLRRIIENVVVRTGARVALVVNHPTTREGEAHRAPNGRSYEENKRAYDAVLRRVAGETRSLLLDVEAAFRAAPRPLAELLIEDGLHLNEAGAEVYAQAVEGFLRGEGFVP
jgi:lysophospholipase L1-like esterase